MKTIKMILKGILLWGTCLSCLITIMGIDSIYEAHLSLWAVLINVILFITCYKTLSLKEIFILSGSQLLNDWLS